MLKTLKKFNAHNTVKCSQDCKMFQHNKMVTTLQDAHNIEKGSQPRRAVIPLPPPTLFLYPTTGLTVTGLTVMQLCNNFILCIAHTLSKL